MESNFPAMWMVLGVERDLALLRAQRRARRLNGSDSRARGCGQPVWARLAGWLPALRRVGAKGQAGSSPGPATYPSARPT